MTRYLCVLVFIASLLPPAMAEDNPMFHSSGLPLPRYVSLKSDYINVRVGPGERYPIRWVFRKARLPVEIVEEFGHWRKIRDIENSEGWIYKNLLSGERTALIRQHRRPLYRGPDANSGTVLEVDPLVPGTLLECTAHWCRLAFEGYKGWIRRDFIWGVYPDERIDAD